MQLFMGLLISSMVLGDVWHVPEDCQTIQAAIDAAGDGDEIVVAAGVWKEQLEISGKTLLIRSESGAAHPRIGHVGAACVRASDFRYSYDPRHSAGGVWGLISSQCDTEGPSVSHWLPCHILWFT